MGELATYEAGTYTQLMELTDLMATGAQINEKARYFMLPYCYMTLQASPDCPEDIQSEGLGLCSEDFEAREAGQRGAKCGASLP